MAIFNYTLPSGSQFKVEAPAGTTQLQADKIFYEQVAAGSLIGYEVGQSLTSVASRITKFELSRLDRGTAGVDTITVLSIVQNLPITAGIPDLVNVPVEDPVDQADIVSARGSGLGPTAVGMLTSFQVQTLQAQLINQVAQDSNVITQEKGIGKYGFNCLQLEQAGYVKPGTWAKFLSESPDQFVSVMNSPGIWTGLGGVNTLDDLLLDENTQNVVQNQLMQVSYDSLLSIGAISNIPQPGVSLSQGQVFTASGLQRLTALSSLGITGLIGSGVGGIFSGASTLASGALGNLSLAQTAIGITNKITGEVGALINNASKFGSVAAAAWAKSGGIPSLSTLTTGLSNLPSLPNINISQLTAGLTNLVPPDLSALKAGLDKLGKASQFSLNFSNPLSQLSSLASNIGGNLVSGTQLAAGFSNTVNRATVNGAVTRILGNSKIPVPSFEFPSSEALAQSVDIRQAQNILQGLRQQGSQVLNRASELQAQATQIQGQATRIAGQASSTFNRITG